MTNEQLCALALAAIDNVDARVVLADAVNESEWTDDRLFGDWVDEAGLTWSVVYISARFGDVKSKAIAAVLLFGEWPTSWPLAERCQIRRMSPAEQFDLISRMHTMGFINADEVGRLFDVD